MTLPRHQVSLVYAVGRVHQGIRRELRRRLSPLDLGPAELTVLSVLRRRPGLSNAQLARRAMVAPQSMIEILSRLEQRRLVRRRLDPAHGRILRAELTAAGAELLDAAEGVIEALEDEMLAEVPAEQREMVLKVMLGAMERLRSGLEP